MSDTFAELADREQRARHRAFISDIQDIIIQAAYAQNVLRAARCYGERIVTFDAPRARGQNNISLELDDEALKDISAALADFTRRREREIEYAAQALAQFEYLGGD